MKFYIIFFLAVFFISCMKSDISKETSLRSVSILIDVTDKQPIYPTEQNMLTLLHCTKNPDADIRFRLGAITDRQLTSDYTVHLLSALVTERESNEDGQHRNRCIVAFYDSVRAIYNTFFKAFDTTQKEEYSEIFRSICAQITWLQATGSKEQVLCAYTDLFEKSSICNAYIQAKESDIPSLLQKFNEAHLLPEHLPGLTVLFVYTSSNRISSARYSTMFEVYKRLLTSRGGRVLIETTNQNIEE